MRTDIVANEEEIAPTPEIAAEVPQAHFQIESVVSGESLMCAEFSDESPMDIDDNPSQLEYVAPVMAESVPVTTPNMEHPKIRVKAIESMTQTAQPKAANKFNEISTTNVAHITGRREMADPKPIASVVSTQTDSDSNDLLVEMETQPKLPTQHQRSNARKPTPSRTGSAVQPAKYVYVLPGENQNQKVVEVNGNIIKRTVPNQAQTITSNPTATYQIIQPTLSQRPQLNQIQRKTPTQIPAPRIVITLNSALQGSKPTYQIQQLAGKHIVRLQKNPIDSSVAQPKINTTLTPVQPSSNLPQSKQPVQYPPQHAVLTKVDRPIHRVLSNAQAVKPIDKPALPVQPNNLLVQNGNGKQRSVAMKSSSARPPKLWNNVMQTNDNGKEWDVVMVANSQKTTQNNSVFDIQTNVIENATTNSSTLKIGQVFGSVSEDFVEELLVEKDKSAGAENSLLDSMEMTKKNNSIVDEDPTQINIIPSSDEKGLDYRCNTCLEFNETFADYSYHMMSVHGDLHACENCSQTFESWELFDKHFFRGQCIATANVRRMFICIVDPPIILMKKEDVFAFKCRHCSSAFHNQRNYLQHAQRHATRFRCKECQKVPPMTTEGMKEHIKTHEKKLQSTIF